MMTDEKEKVKEKLDEVVEEISPRKPETTHKDIGATTTPPKATVPRTEKVAPTTTSGIDTTANMDADQRKKFEEIKAKAQTIPQTIGTSRPFCERMQAVRERRRLRKERKANRG